MCQHGEMKIITKHTKFTNRTNSIISFWLKIRVCVCVERGGGEETERREKTLERKQEVLIIAISEW